ncbi:GNAT family N-acetyltransferase [Jannaschia seohaensis]|nr:GNAT family protein [Jannaschia seohaensis]
MHLETERLVLRPVTLADSAEIAETIFSDPNVVGMLAHNTKTADDALLEAERWTSIMGIDGSGGIWENGGMGLFAVLPKTAEDRLAGVAGFYMEKNERDLWTGEYFYALGSDWHGRGLMSEAADLFGKKLREMKDLGVIYAGYWDLINEASGRLLMRTGLRPKGRKPVTEEYSPERCLRMFDYDLWRLQEADSPRQKDDILLQAARRAGAFVAEDVLDKDIAIRFLEDSYGSTLTKDALTMLEKAIAQPGMSYLEIRGPRESGTPVNRLR